MSAHDNGPQSSGQPESQESLQLLREENARLKTRVQELEAQVFQSTVTYSFRLDLLHQIIDSVPHMIYVKDGDGRYLLANQTMAQVYNTTVEQLTGTLQQDWHPDKEELDLFLEEDREIAVGGTTRQSMEHIFTDASGEQRLLKTIKVPFLISEGKTAILGVSLDYTQRKQTERALQQSRARYESLFHSSMGCVSILDVEGRIVECNQRWVEMLGQDSPEGIIGTSFFEYVHQEDRAQFKANFYALLDREIDSYLLRKRFIRRFGQIVWLEYYAIPVLDHTGAVNCIMGIGVDITAVTRMQRELVHAKESAEQANKAKGEFLANMSHEIRTPLNVIVGAGDLLLREEPTEKQAEYVEIIQNSSAVLLELINNILDFSKIEAGKMPLEQIPFNLFSLIDSLLELFRELTAAKGLDLSVDWASDLPEILIGDSTRFKQILVNLLSNALKFTEQGSITLYAERREQDGQEYCVVRVQDTGIGISKEKIKDLFNCFTQADGSISRKYGGTGLGLTICLKLTQLMGGELSVESSPGAGSLFTVAIPLSSSNTPPQILKNGLLAHSDKLMVLVTPKPDLCRALKKRLQEFGLKGRDCQAERLGTLLEKMPRNLQATVFVDADVLQTVLPVLESFPKERLPEIFVLLKPGTSLPQSPLPLRSILSPPRRCELYAACKDGAKSYSLNVFAEEEPSDTPFTGVSVLLAEDSPVNQLIVRELLEQAGCSVDTADNGLAAVELAKKKKYDIALMDVQMPSMDGLKATGIIKQDLGLRTLPVIALTAFALEGDEARCLEAGMDYYLSKPVKRRELYATMEKTLTRSGRLPAKQTESIPSARTNSFPEGVSLPEMDLKDAEERLGGKWSFYCNLVRGFATLYGEIGTTFETLLQAGDYEELRRQVHMLKGASANISAYALNSAASTLDVALDGKQPDAAAVSGLLDTLQQKLAVVVANANRLSE